MSGTSSVIIEAAATMGRLRTSIRALSEVDPSPARIVTRLVVAEGRDPSEMVATVLVALLDRDRNLIVLYTDGLVEDRASSIDDGLQLIARTTTERRERADPVDGVADALMAARPLGSSQDDVALLVVHCSRTV